MSQEQSAEKTRKAVEKYTARATLFTCPLSRCLIVNAVLFNGQRYERADLDGYIDFCKIRRLPCMCPTTRAEMRACDIAPDPQFAQIVEEFVKEVTAKAAKDSSREQWADLLDDCTRWTQAKAGAGAAPAQPYSYSEPEPIVTRRTSIHSPTSPVYSDTDDAMPEDDNTPTTPVYTGAQQDSAIVLEDSDDEQPRESNGPSGPSGSGTSVASGDADSPLIGCIVSYTHDPERRAGIVSEKRGTAITLSTFTGSIVQAQEEHIQPAPVRIYDTVKILSGPLAHKTGVLRATTGTGEGVVVLADGIDHDSGRNQFVPLAACAPILGSN
jgi:hypothetical protein